MSVGQVKSLDEICWKMDFDIEMLPSTRVRRRLDPAVYRQMQLPKNCFADHAGYCSIHARTRVRISLLCSVDYHENTTYIK